MEFVKASTGPNPMGYEMRECEIIGNFKENVIMMTKISKRRKVMNFLSNSDKGLTESEARSMFGVNALPSVISSIKKQVECNGNWEIVKERTPRNKVRYFMNDTHPGTRSYGFNRDGSRYAI